MEMSFLFLGRNKRHKKIYAIHFSSGYWSLVRWLACCAWSIRSSTATAAEVPSFVLKSKTAIRDPGSTFFLLLRLHLRLHLHFSCCPPPTGDAQYSAFIHWARVPTNFVPLLPSSTAGWLVHNHKKTQKVTWRPCQIGITIIQLPRFAKTDSIPRWSSEISYNMEFGLPREEGRRVRE